VGVAGIEHIDIYKAPVLAGLFVGGMIPSYFQLWLFRQWAVRQWRW